MRVCLCHPSKNLLFYLISYRYQIHNLSYQLIIIFIFINSYTYLQLGEDLMTWSWTDHWFLLIPPNLLISHSLSHLILLNLFSNEMLNHDHEGESYFFKNSTSNLISFEPQVLKFSKRRICFLGYYQSTNSLMVTHALGHMIYGWSTNKSTLLANVVAVAFYIKLLKKPGVLFFFYLTSRTRIWKLKVLKSSKFLPVGVNSPEQEPFMRKFNYR